MKRNLVSILILALLIVNIILTSIMMFSVTGAANKTTALIDDISKIINLELTNKMNTSSSTGTTDVPIEDIEPYAIQEEMTIPLLKGADGKDHYYLVRVTLSMNKTDPDYAKYGATISSQEDLIKGEIIKVISNHTMEEIQEDIDAIRQELLESIQNMYQSSFIFNVTITKGIAQ
ncbi:MAG: flagellar basal body-associated FliL family protein [Lachnospiraceae bacterium]